MSLPIHTIYTCELWKYFFLLLFSLPSTSSTYNPVVVLKLVFKETSVLPALLSSPFLLPCWLVSTDPATAVTLQAFSMYYTYTSWVVALLVGCHQQQQQVSLLSKARVMLTSYSLSSHVWSATHRLDEMLDGIWLLPCASRDYHFSLSWILPPLRESGLENSSSWPCWCWSLAGENKPTHDDFICSRFGENQESYQKV